MKEQLMRISLVFCLFTFANSSFGNSGGFFQVSDINPVTDFSHLDSPALKKLTHKEDSSFIKAFNKDGDQPPGRIVGGSDANIEDYPWQVALLNSNGSQNCAGTILSEYWILTAVHCGMPAKVRAGVTNKTDNTGQDRTVAHRIVHPLYTPYQNDVALLLLNEPLDLSDPKVQAISIATQAHVNEGYTDAGVMSVITGWGNMLEGGSPTNILQVAEIPLVSNEDAVNFGGYNPGQITDDMLCAGYMGVGGIDACQGDSGGPLVVPDPGNDQGFVLAGVTSWGFGCARPEYPGVWARVSHFENWIHGHTGLTWPSPLGLPNLSDFTAEASESDQIQLSWNQNVLNNDVVIALSDDGFFGSPVNGISYSTGDTIPDGGTVLYSGSDTAYLHTDLEPGTVYFYKAWAVDNQLEYSIGRFVRDTTDCLKFTLPFTETFEDDSGSRNCWSQIKESSNRSWIFASGSSGGNVKNAKTGQKNARFTSSSGGSHITKLVSPVLNLMFYEDVELSFWYAQQSWFGDQNLLNIFYRTTETEPWIQIGDTLSASISSWTHVQNITLPNPSHTYQIAFEGIDLYGHANVIDQVEITGIYTGPPDELFLQNLQIEQGNDHCYAATGQVYVAGSGSTFVVENGGSAVIAAGQAIHFYDGARIKSGGMLHAYIDTAWMFCTQQENLLMVRNEELIDEETSMIWENELSNGLKIYPNPTTGEFTVHITPEDGVLIIFVEVYSMLGENMLTLKLPAKDKYIFNLSGKQPGIYIVRILMGASIMTEKLVIN